ncbi:MAG: hypothetical protein WAW80_02160 [Candidatus Saccharimonadales bacterium]
MHKLFHRFSRKDNINILRRELALAHTCIALLALIIIALLSIVDGINGSLITIIDTLLGIVAIISISIVFYIVKTRK